MNHILTIEDMPIARINRIMDMTNEILEQDDWNKSLDDKTLVSLFLEPSTRTRVSFDLAAKKLGGDVVSLVGKEATSMAKEEDLKDTLGSLSQFGDVIAIRHFEKITSFDLELCDVPVINAGDGDSSHPTQALTDLFTIRERFPKLEKLNVLVMGDCKNSRAIHSFVAVCLKFDMNVVCYSPKDIELPLHQRSVKGAEKKAKLIEEKDLEGALNVADVIYLIRFQKERHKSYHTTYMAGGETKTTEHNYVMRCGFKEEMLAKLNRKAIILHPFPRGLELPKKVDKTRHASYFQQMQNSLYVRMAILEEVLLSSDEDYEE